MNEPSPTPQEPQLSDSIVRSGPMANDRKQAIRIRRYLLATLAYATSLPLLFVASRFGFISLESVYTVAAVFVAVNLPLYFMFRSGLNQRFADPSLTREQTILAITVLMFVVYHLDEGRELALMMCLIIFVFGVFRLSRREFLVMTLFVLAAYALVISLLVQWRPETVNANMAWMSWLVLAAFLPWFAVVGGKISALRHSLRHSNLEIVAAMDRIRTMATHDSLTGLPNRTLFAETFEQALGRARRNGANVAVMYIDVDRFKRINDSLGQRAGDAVLREMARRLKSSVRVSDIVARIAGDGFMVVVDSGQRKDTSGLAARKLLASVSQPMQIERQDVHLSISVGVAAFPADGTDSESLVAKAELAMQRSRRLGPNGFQYYSEEMNLRSIEHLELETALRRAIERDELRLHYQPKVDMATDRIAGAEALVRWQHPRHGLVNPAQFISLAEETGLIVPIGRWVLRKACADLQSWQERNLPVVPIAINLSSREFQSATLVEDVLATLREHRLPVRRIEFEITESMVMNEPERAVGLMHELRSAGIGLALDDFGTGYSSLAYLKRFPLTHLKIDRSFVQGLPDDPGDFAITAAVIALARSLRLNTVAEGVESAEQLASLRGQGCGQAQGYYFSRPLTEAALVKLLGASRLSAAIDFNTGPQPA